MYDQDFINDGYGSQAYGGPLHKVDCQPGLPLCGATFKYLGQFTSRTRVRWSKVTCKDCLDKAPKQVRAQLALS